MRRLEVHGAIFRREARARLQDRGVQRNTGKADRRHMIHPSERRRAGHARHEQPIGEAAAGGRGRGAAVPPDTRRVTVDRARLQPLECRHGSDAVHRKPGVPRHVGLQASARRTHKTHARMHARSPGDRFARGETLTFLDYATCERRDGGTTRHERTACLQKELRDQYGVAGCIPHEHIKGVSCDRAKQRGVFVDRYGATCSMGTPHHRRPFPDPGAHHTITQRRSSTR